MLGVVEDHKSTYYEVHGARIVFMIHSVPWSKHVNTQWCTILTCEKDPIYYSTTPPPLALPCSAALILLCSHWSWRLLIFLCFVFCYWMSYSSCVIFCYKAPYHWSLKGTRNSFSLYTSECITILLKKAPSPMKDMRTLWASWHRVIATEELVSVVLLRYIAELNETHHWKEFFCPLVLPTVQIIFQKCSKAWGPLGKKISNF